MKRAHCFSALLTALALALTGCGKSKEPPPANVSNGTTIDLPKLKQALASASVDVRKQLMDAQFAVRDCDYPKALAGLNQIAATASLTEDQKKVVNAVIEQVKQAASPAPQPQT